MALDYDGVNQLDRLSFAASANFLATGPFTALVVLRRSADSGAASRYPVALTNNDSPQSGIGFSATTDTLRIPGSTNTTTLTVKAADGWVCCGWSKGDGAATPRGHKYRYSDGEATHEWAAAGIAAGGAAVNGLFLARYGMAGTANAFAGTIAAAAVWTRSLTDAEVELASTSVAAMLGTAPLILALIDGLTATSAIIDLAGNSTRVDVGGNNGSVSSLSVPLTYGFEAVVQQDESGASPPPLDESTATAALTLPGLTAAATATHPVIAAAGPTLPVLSSSATAQTPTTSVGSTTLGSLSLTSVATVPARAVTTVPLPALASTAEVDVPVRGPGAHMLPALQVASVAAAPAAGVATMALLLPVIAGDADAQVVANGAVSVSIAVSATDVAPTPPAARSPGKSYASSRDRGAFVRPARYAASSSRSQLDW